MGSPGQPGGLPSDAPGPGTPSLPPAVTVRPSPLVCTQAPKFGEDLPEDAHALGTLPAHLTTPHGPRQEGLGAPYGSDSPRAVVPPAGQCAHAQAGTPAQTGGAECTGGPAGAGSRVPAVVVVSALLQPKRRGRPPKARAMAPALAAQRPHPSPLSLPVGSVSDLPVVPTMNVEGSESEAAIAALFLEEALALDTDAPLLAPPEDDLLCFQSLFSQELAPLDSELELDVLRPPAGASPSAPSSPAIGEGRVLA